MKPIRSTLVRALCACIITACAAPVYSAGDPDPRQAELTKTAEGFAAAFAAGDAKAVAACWTPDGDFVDLEGRVVKGRQAIEADFADLFRQNKGLKVRIDVASVRFPTADTAIEDGTSAVIAPDGSLPNRARYTNFLVKRDGKWLLSSVRESAYVPPSNQERLRGLEWMIGEWADQATDGHVAHAVFDWSPDQNFIICLRAVRVKDSFLDNGTQRIGWDPAAKQIRSWSFEPDGGFGESVWSRSGENAWSVKSSSVLQSGHKVTSTTIITQVDAGTVTWQSKDQQVDGKPVADSPVVTMKRIN
jgi:uncharacterized protein (TIGR02246 family)